MMTPGESSEGMLDKKGHSKIPSLLENLHSSVSKVNMVGLNSSSQYSIDFIPGNRGVQQ